MSAKDVRFHDSARARIVKGVNVLADAVKVTLGPKGSLYVTRQTLFTHMATRESTQAMADELFAVVGSGQVKIHIAQRYALADAAQAHRDLEARKTIGSSILIP